MYIYIYVYKNLSPSPPPLEVMMEVMEKGGEGVLGGSCPGAPLTAQMVYTAT